jgi:hypothetical protein
MSAPPLSKILRFLLIAAGLIILLSALWTFVDSGYSQFLGNITANFAPADYKVEQRDGTIYFTREYFIVDVAGKPTPVRVPDNYPPDAFIVASAIQFGLLLTFALVAATPGLNWRKRILFSLIAAAVTFILQILSVIIMAKTFNSVLFVVVSDLFPPVLWAIFSFRYWFTRQPGHPRDISVTPVKKQTR